MRPSEALSYARKLRRNQTPSEKFFWEKVRNKQFHNFKFYRQHRVKYMNNRQHKYFIADFYCRQNKLIIEIDGPIHQKTVDYDNRRTEILNSLGYTVLRFTNYQVLHKWETVAKELLQVLGNSPGPY
jgi:very-short-patch-repair endonuclease